MALYERADEVTSQDLSDYAASADGVTYSEEQLRQLSPEVRQAYIDKVAEFAGRRAAGLEGDRALAFAQDLQARAEGTAGPSMAEQQLRQQIGTAARGQIGAAQRVGGRFAAGAARAGAMSADRIEAAGDTAATALRQQEQQQAQQQLDMFLLAQEQQGQQMALAREQMDFQRQQAEDAGNRQLFSGILSGIGALTGFFGTGMNPAGAVAGAQVGASFSDKRMKTNIDRKAGMEGAYQFLESLEGAKYDLPANRERGSFGVMAQSAERTPMGRSFVERTPEGVRTLNAGKGFNALLLAQKSLHERLKRLEGGE